MAIRLTEPGAGQLLDFFGGLVGSAAADHSGTTTPNSFIEDPTRILSSCSLCCAARVHPRPPDRGFYSPRHRKRVFYAQMQQQVRQVPALQSRLKNELKYILEAHYWQPALRLLDQLRALRCIHSDLAMTPSSGSSSAASVVGSSTSAGNTHCPPWQIRLETLLATIPNPSGVTLPRPCSCLSLPFHASNTLDCLEQRWL